MNIGLYGDSFGAASLSPCPELGNINTTKGMDYHWITLLKNELQCEVFNYSLSGASIYHCYKEFMKTHHLHDKNFFLITFPARYPKSFTFKGNPGVIQNIVSLSHIDSFIKNNICLDEDLEILNDMRGWYKMECEEFNVDVSELMINEIIHHRPDTIFIPCFGGKLIENIAHKINIKPHQVLCTLYYHQMKQLALDDTGMNSAWQENSLYISGHLTPEYNRIVYNALSHRLKTGEWTLEEPTNSVKLDRPADTYYLKN